MRTNGKIRAGIIGATGYALSLIHISINKACIRMYGNAVTTLEHWEHTGKKKKEGYALCLLHRT